jgi:pyruvate/2-oxoglutarate dehydrogenase complex dihydrolipoamide dehydrogenase (E3) component
LSENEKSGAGSSGGDTAAEAQAFDLLIIGAGPAGVFAALRAGDLKVKAALVTNEAFGGMAANDGPVPVRALAHAARLIRDAHQLGEYGIAVGKPVLEYSRLIQRVKEVVKDVRSQSFLRPMLAMEGVTIFENAGAARFLDANTVVTQSGLKIRARKVILCTGGASRKLDVPGAELTKTHSDAWGLKEVPESMLVIGAGATGAQVASIFQGFGTKVSLFHAGARILPTEDHDVSEEMAAAFGRAGMDVRIGFGTIERFEKTDKGVRMWFVSKEGKRDSVEASLVVVTVGWAANTEGLNLEAAGVEVNERHFIKVDPFLRTSAKNIYAAGDITGRLMLVPQAVQDGYVATTNAIQDCDFTLGQQASPIGSFTDPEYAQVGLTEEKAREKHEVLTVVLHFNMTARTIIDGYTEGFCKLVVDKADGKILGCHVVGERAVEIVQAAAIAMTGGLAVDVLAKIPLSYPTYIGVLGRAAANAARQLGLAPHGAGH